MIEAQSVSGFAHETLGVTKPLQGASFYIKASCAMRFGADPQIPVGAVAHAMYGEPVQPFDLLPPNSRWTAITSQQPSLGANPQCSIGPGLDFIHDIARQTAGSGVAFPLLIPTPLDQTPARQTDPQRVPPVLENRIHGSAETESAVDFLPVFPLPNQQPSWGRQQDAPRGINPRYADHGTGSRHIGPAKFGLAPRQHKHAGIPLSGPKTRVKSSSLRQSFRAHPYQRMSPSTKTASTLGPGVAGDWGNP